jgi:hypothetical protein
MHDVIQIIDRFHILRIRFIGTFRHDRETRGQRAKGHEMLEMKREWDTDYRDS